MAVVTFAQVEAALAQVDASVDSAVPVGPVAAGLVAAGLVAVGLVAAGPVAAGPPVAPAAVEAYETAETSA